MTTEGSQEFEEEYTRSMQVMDDFGHIDLKYVKYDVRHYREYQSDSVDDILPEVYESRMREIRKKEDDAIRRARFNFEY